MMLMQAIIVDDEPWMIRKFKRLSSSIHDLNIIGQFNTAQEAIDFSANNDVDIAFLDVEMPGMNGVELAAHLRKFRQNILIVLITAHENYLMEANRIGVDYYVIKPYTSEVLKTMMEKLRLLAVRQDKEVSIQMFGRFLVKKNDKPIPLTGKAKEILAYIVMNRGREVSNEEIYATIWEGRPFDNASMGVYYNALKRLRRTLSQVHLENLLVSTRHGQTVDIKLFDCDYYTWKDNTENNLDVYEGGFLSEYSWGEYFLKDMHILPGK